MISRTAYIGFLLPYVFTSSFNEEYKNLFLENGVVFAWERREINKKNIAHNSLEFQVLCYKLQWNKNIDTHWKKIRGPCLNKCLQASCLKYTNYKWGNEKSSCRRKVCYWVNIGSLKFLGLVTTELQLKKLHSFTPICLQRSFRHGTCLNTCNVLELVFCAWKVRLMLWQFDNQNLSWEIILNLFKI